MDENKSKGKGVSIVMILLAVVLGFGLVIGLTQTSGAQNLNNTQSEISNYLFDEDGTLLSYSGDMTELEIPSTYSLSSVTEEVQMTSSSISGLVNRANELGIKHFEVENQTGSYTDDFGNTFYQEKYVLTYQKRKTIEGDDYQVKEIAANAFSNNRNITSVKLPEHLEIINSNAFNNCIKLKSVEFPETLSRIENSAFYNCRVLTDVKLPDSVRYIGAQAFANCDKITTFTIPKGISYISDMLFENCDGLTEITIPSNVNFIGNNAFHFCRNLKSVVFEEGINAIYSNAFYGCRYLTEITLPSTINNIHHQAFWNCVNLRTVIINTTHVPYIDYNPFNINYIQGIYVKDEILAEYPNHAYWSNYINVLKPISTLENAQ